MGTSTPQNNTTEVEVLARNLMDVGFKYNWKITDYLKGLDGEKDVDSPVFSISVNGLNTEWSLGIRYWTDESGNRLTNPVVICLNLVKASGSQSDMEVLEQLQVRYQYGIWNNVVKQYEVCPVAYKSVDVCVNQTLQCVGTRDIMILDRHLVGKSIEIFCKIMMIREEVEQNTLSLDLWTHLRNGQGCDMKIRTSDGSLIPAHKTILTCRSSAVSELIDEEGILRLDMTTPLLTSLLQYIYTDRVDPLDNPQHLLKFSIKLRLPGLKNICEKALIDQIAPTTVASLLLIADTFQCADLKKAALAYCGENARSIVKTVSWKVMEEVNPKLFEEVCDQM